MKGLYVVLAIAMTTMSSLVVLSSCSNEDELEEMDVYTLSDRMATRAGGESDPRVLIKEVKNIPVRCYRTGHYNQIAYSKTAYVSIDIFRDPNTKVYSVEVIDSKSPNVFGSEIVTAYISGNIHIEVQFFCEGNYRGNKEVTLNGDYVFNY